MNQFSDFRIRYFTLFILALLCPTVLIAGDNRAYQGQIVNTTEKTVVLTVSSREPGNDRPSRISLPPGRILYLRKYPEYSIHINGAIESQNINVTTDTDIMPWASRWFVITSSGDGNDKISTGLPKQWAGEITKDIVEVVKDYGLPLKLYPLDDFEHHLANAFLMQVATDSVNSLLAKKLEKSKFDSLTLTLASEMDKENLAIGVQDMFMSDEYPAISPEFQDFVFRILKNSFLETEVTLLSQIMNYGVCSPSYELRKEFYYFDRRGRAVIREAKMESAFARLFNNNGVLVDKPVRINANRLPGWVYPTKTWKPANKPDLFRDVDVSIRMEFEYSLRPMEDCVCIDTNVTTICSFATNTKQRKKHLTDDPNVMEMSVSKSMAQKTSQNTITEFLTKYVDDEFATFNEHSDPN